MRTLFLHFLSAFLFFSLLITCNVVCSQSSLPPSKLDSLWSVWDNPSSKDIERLKAMDEIAWEGYLFIQPDSAFYFAQLLYNLAKDVGLKDQMANALNTQGVSYYLRSDYDKAIDCHNRGMKIREEIGDKPGIARSLNNIGAINENQGKYSVAIDYYNRSLKIFEEISDKKGIAGSLNNIGIIYEGRGDYTRAIDYYTRSLKMKQELGDKQGIAISLNNIGTAYGAQGNYKMSIDYCQQSLMLRKEIGDISGVATSLNNLGTIYQTNKDNDMASEYYSQSLELFEKIGDKQGVARVLNNIGSIYKDLGMALRKECNCSDDGGNFVIAIEYFTKSLKMREAIGDKKGMTRVLNNFGEILNIKKEYSKSIMYSNRALELAQSSGLLSETSDAAKHLFEALKEVGQFKRSLLMHELYIQSRDSIINEENQKEIVRQEFKNRYERQLAADSVAFLKHREINELKIAQQQSELKVKRNQQFGLFGGLLIVTIFAGFIYNRFKVTKHQKEIIQVQKAEVDNKNEQIIESIEYASRLQVAILPPVSSLTDFLPESFIIYKPKDIVAGDLYWTQKKGDTVYFAAADCTGHGVPAAMISVVCCTALNRSVNEFELTQPGEILDKARELVVETFNKSNYNLSEGMDISLGALNNDKLIWAGANNPLWIIRNGELLEIKPDRQPVGKSDSYLPFTTQNVQVVQGDSIYVFTDGFVDQFGGPDFKKYKAVNFKKLLLKIQDLNMSAQKLAISQVFEEWKGEHDQIDDVCVIGIKI